MGTTSIPNGSALALKRWSQGLYAMAVKQPTQLNSLAGPMPTIDDASGILRKQSTDGMPIVRINDLASSPGDKVEMDCAQVVKLRAIMGDRNAEGQGASLKFSMQEIRIDMATLPVSAGGKMTQKR